MKEYETERLYLKVLGSAYARRVQNYYQRNRQFLEEWEPARPEGFYTLEYHVQKMHSESIGIENGSMLRLWVVKKADPEKVIGLVGFNNMIRGAFQSCHLGYGLDGEEINKGYMTEAIEKGIEIIFGEYRLHRIEANIMPRNTASIKVVEKLGFYNEGLAYQYLKINGKWEDHIHMVLLNDQV